MKKTLAFLVFLTLLQSVALPAHSGVTEATPKSISDGRYVAEDFTMGPGTAGNAAALKATKKAYYGAGSTDCPAHAGTDCQSDGACCEGGARCRILLKKLKKLSGVISGFFVKDFCT